MGNRGGAKSKPSKRIATPPFSTTKRTRKETYSPPALELTQQHLNSEGSDQSDTDSMSGSSLDSLESNVNENAVKTPATENAMTNTTAQLSSSSPKPTVRFPPIFVQTSPSLPWHKIAKEMFKIDGLEEVTAKITSTPSQIKINCPDEKSFRNVQHFLEANRETLQYFTFPVQEERSLKVVIKGLPTYITDTELTDELKLLGFQPQQVRAFQKDGKRIPIHMVSLKMTENAKDIFNIPDILYVRVKIESYKNSGPAQCYNCQHFGHSSTNCNQTPRCVKCGKEHSTKDCSKPKSDKATCCNCGGEHTANYRGCPHYIEKHKPKPTLNAVRAEIAHQNAQIARPITSSQPTQTVQPSSSYAEIAKTHSPSPIDPAASAIQILGIIKTLLATLKECPDFNAKEAIINTVISILNVIPDIKHV